MEYWTALRMNLPVLIWISLKHIVKKSQKEKAGYKRLYPDGYGGSQIFERIQTTWCSLTARDVYRNLSDALQINFAPEPS